MGPRAPPEGVEGAEEVDLVGREREVLPSKGSRLRRIHWVDVVLSWVMILK